VIELTDETISSTIYNSPYIWVIEFYAHWCGHCQKFANTWKKIANEMQGMANNFHQLLSLVFLREYFEMISTFVSHQPTKFLMLQILVLSQKGKRIYKWQEKNCLYSN
jgi:hypothetical protein